VLFIGRGASSKTRSAADLALLKLLLTPKAHLLPSLPGSSRVSGGAGRAGPRLVRGGIGAVLPSLPLSPLET
jgi:hypothetical protein